MVSYNGFAYTIFFLFLVFGAVKLYDDGNVDDALKTTLIQEGRGNVGMALLFIKSLDELTPTLDYDLPFTDKKIILINQFPLIGWSHIIMTVLLITLSSIMMHLFHIKKGWIFTVFLLMILLGYILGTLVVYFAYEWSSSELGFTSQEADTFREQYSSKFDNFVVPLLVMSLLAFITFGKVIFKKMR